ncbi:MAG: hypothetical protein AAGA15_05610 [Pseudomonadota bacterium]
MIKQALSAAALILGLSNPSTAATFSVDWQPISVCADATTCGTLDFDAAELQRIFSQADISINILPIFSVIDPISYSAFSGSTSIPDVLNVRRPGATADRLSTPLTTWFLENSIFQTLRTVGLISRSGVVIEPPAVGSTLAAQTDTASLIIARGISQNLGLVALSGNDCLPDNIQNTIGSGGPGTCELGTMFTDAQIATMQSSRFLTMAVIPLPAGLVLLVSALSLLAIRGRFAKSNSSARAPA